LQEGRFINKFSSHLGKKCPGNDPETASLPVRIFHERVAVENAAIGLKRVSIGWM
jgi:hypothetical protein